MQFSQEGLRRLHFSLFVIVSQMHTDFLKMIPRESFEAASPPCYRTRATHFLCLQAAQERGTRLRFLTTRYWPSGECAAMLEDVVEGGVGTMMNPEKRSVGFSAKKCVDQKRR